ncbi:hypothetical protein PYW08_006159 [Mythimna loreyi]|uniref:Uncharacterized protein n=1 Tax=Mythimna loreyi TaxID=667449 RepID=A0ACC2QNS4_9NEOP|nr:hypothetical protein PYW08_006159 [Mythimna loreyi]
MSSLPSLPTPPSVAVTVRSKTRSKVPVVVAKKAKKPKKKFSLTYKWKKVPFQHRVETLEDDFEDLDIQEIESPLEYFYKFFSRDIIEDILQGKGKLVWELMSEVKSFTRKLDLFINDVGSERLHFPNLNKIISSDSEIDVGQYKTFITDLKSEFENRFADLKKIENVVEILSSIYSLHPDGEWSNEAANVFGSDKATLQIKMIDFQENSF